MSPHNCYQSPADATVYGCRGSFFTFFEYLIKPLIQGIAIKLCFKHVPGPSAQREGRTRAADVPVTRLKKPTSTRIILIKALIKGIATMNVKSARNWAREGHVFTTPYGNTSIEENLGDVRILHTGIDTLKQLYEGQLSTEYEVIKNLYETQHGAIYEIDDIPFKLGSGGASGYLYRLQNNDIGVIIFYASKYKKHDEDKSSGPNLKIELSPHFIHDTSLESIQSYIDQIGNKLLDKGWKHSGVAVHLAADVQGWEIPADFDERFATRAKRQFSYKGVSDCVFEGLDASVRHNRLQTVTYGNANSTQFTIYDKSQQALDTDKLHFWENIWRQASGVELDDQPYNDNQRVTRIELRFHHSVIKQFSDANYVHQYDDGREYTYDTEQLHSIRNLGKCLNQLWSYGLMRYRLQYNTTTIDPFWQILIEDVHFYEPDSSFVAKRLYKKPGIGCERNVMLAIGNIITLFARKRMSADHAFRYFKLSGWWEDIQAYYWSRGLSAEHFKQNLAQALQDRILAGAAA